MSGVRHRRKGDRVERELIQRHKVVDEIIRNFTDGDEDEI